MRHGIQSELERTWLATPNCADLTSWSPRYIARFLRELGTEYDFLVNERAARFVSNGRKHRTGMDWAVATVRAGSLLIRFVRDRGSIEVSIASVDAPDRSFSLEPLAVWCTLQRNSLAGDGMADRVRMPALSSILRANFSSFEEALLPENTIATTQGVRQIVSDRASGKLDVLHEYPDRGFLANYASTSDAISRVPFWKPLGTYVGMILLLPLLPVLLLFAFFLRLRTKLGQPSVKSR